MMFVKVIIAVFVFLSVVAIVKKPGSVYRNLPSEQNPMEGMKVRFVTDDAESNNADGICGHLEAIAFSHGHRSFYDRVVKRCVDVVLSFCGLIILSPFCLIISILIVFDDPGTVFFTQKRVGRNKQYFRLHKFRTMKMNAPHDIPTHMLENPEQYLTKVGKVLRRTSLDELPQIGDIFIGNMSIIGPRPALWNQELLIACRDQYGANEIRPGLTGWAQINGRDELGIEEKAKLDGMYSSVLASGGFRAVKTDIKCFFGTFFSVVRGDGIVEGKER